MSGFDAAIAGVHGRRLALHPTRFNEVAAESSTHSSNSHVLDGGWVMLFNAARCVRPCVSVGGVTICSTELEVLLRRDSREDCTANRTGAAKTQQVDNLHL